MHVLNLQALFLELFLVVSWLDVNSIAVVRVSNDGDNKLSLFSFSFSNSPNLFVTKLKLARDSGGIEWKPNAPNFAPMDDHVIHQQIQMVFQL